MFFSIQLVTLGCELAMVFGGVVPYIPQYWQIKQKQTTQVYISSWGLNLTENPQLINRASPFTSAWHYCWPTPSASSSGSASDLRPLSLFRFLGNFIKKQGSCHDLKGYYQHYISCVNFAFPQSVLMNVAMFALIHLCVSINNKVGVPLHSQASHPYLCFDRRLVAVLGW